MGCPKGINSQQSDHIDLNCINVHVNVIDCFTSNYNEIDQFFAVENSKRKPITNRMQSGYHWQY